MRKILSVATILAGMMAMEGQAQAKFPVPEFLQNFAAKCTRKSAPSLSVQPTVEGYQKGALLFQKQREAFAHIIEFGNQPTHAEKLSYVRENNLTDNTLFVQNLDTEHVWVFHYEVNQRLKEKHKARRPYLGGKTLLQGLFPPQVQERTKPAVPPRPANWPVMKDESVSQETLPEFADLIARFENLKAK